MIKGKNIVELAQELQNQIERKKDYVVDTRELGFSHTSQGFELAVPNQPAAVITEHTHGQISARLGVPKGYYDRLRADHPDLLVDNVRTLFDREPERRMVRTLTVDSAPSVARAFLSDRYRRVDNEQIAEAALPALIKAGDGIDIVSCDVTERKLYIQARFPRLEGEVKVGDPVQAGLIITNSEIGLGALEVRPMIYRLVCTNGMVVPRDIDGGAGLRKQHVGRKVEGGEDFTVYSDETLAADDHALMLKIRDQILALSNPELFLKLIEEMKRSAEGPVVKNPVKAVEELGKAFQLPKGEQDSILESLIRGADYSRWGVLNAVTAQANENASYDRAVELEQLGGSILTLNAGEWQRIAEAA